MFIKDVEKMIIGSVKELVKDKQYFHSSSAGPEYCHLTKEGERAASKMLNLLLPRLLKAQELEDVERSKQIVMNELKGK